MKKENFDKSEFSYAKIMLDHKKRFNALSAKSFEFKKNIKTYFKTKYETKYSLDKRYEVFSIFQDFMIKFQFYLMINLFLLNCKIVLKK